MLIDISDRFRPKKFPKVLGHTVTFAVMSPKGDVLTVFQPDHPKGAKRKLPSESHRSGENRFETLKRGMEEELGIELSLNRVHEAAIQLWNEGFREDGSYRSIFFLLRLTENEFNTHKYIGDEDGKELLIKEIPVRELLHMEQYLEEHQEYFEFLKKFA